MRITNYVAQYAAKDSNLFFSPLSIQLLLGLVAAGATGPTKDQVLSFLSCESVSKVNHLASELISTVLAAGSAYVGPKLSFANGVWVDNRLPLKPVFKQIASNNYKAACEQVDFQIKVHYFPSQSQRILSYCGNHSILYYGTCQVITILFIHSKRNLQSLK